jgi:hypothetical protein
MKIPWFRLVAGALLLILGLVLTRRNIVVCDKEVCAFGDQRIVGGDVREVRVRDVERASIDRLMNREGERRSQVVFLMKSGGKTPATPMDAAYKDEIVTGFAAVQNGERETFTFSYAGVAGYAGAFCLVLGVALLVLAGIAVARRRWITSSR